MLVLKPGVSINGIKPEALYAMNVADRLYEKFDHDCVITAGVEGSHSRASKHYIGHAFDSRTRDFPDPDKKILRDKLSEALGPDFDVVLEKTHLHVEFDPKGGINLKET